MLLEDLEYVCLHSQVTETTKTSQQDKIPLSELLRRHVQQIIVSPIISLLDFEAVCEDAEVSDKKFPHWDFRTMMEHFETSQSSQVNIQICKYY